MKKTLYLLMLVASINGQAFAQESLLKSNSDKTFEQPQDVKRRFTIDLDKGNKVQIELTDLNDLDLLKNLDSIFRMVMHDIEPFKDSLSNGLLSRRVDYTMDSAGTKKIRLQQFAPAGSHYVVRQSEMAALKLEQDTVNYIGIVPYKARKYHREYNALRYYKVSFFLNDLYQLPTYLNGSLQAKIQNLKRDIISGWAWRSDGQMYLVKDNTVSAKAAKGYVTGGDYIGSRLSVDMQNYKHYYVPSFSLGVAVTFSNSYVKREIGLAWEPQFLFAKNSQGNLTTYRNDFLTLTLGQAFIKTNNTKEPPFLTVLSVGYLIKRSGDYYDKNTFRIGVGRLSLFVGKVHIEPAFYFNNFFKGVTPSVRLALSF